MAAGITARQYTNNAVFTEKTKMMMVPLNAVVGTAEDLVAIGVEGFLEDRDAQIIAGPRVGGGDGDHRRDRREGLLE